MMMVDVEEKVRSFELVQFAVLLRQEEETIDTLLPIAMVERGFFRIMQLPNISSRLPVGIPLNQHFNVNRKVQTRVSSFSAAKSRTNIGLPAAVLIFLRSMLVPDIFIISATR